MSAGGLLGLLLIVFVLCEEESLEKTMAVLRDELGVGDDALMELSFQLLRDEKSIILSLDSGRSLLASLSINLNPLQIITSNSSKLI
jgi:hypothetical protein